VNWKRSADFSSFLSSRDESPDPQASALEVRRWSNGRSVKPNSRKADGYLTNELRNILSMNLFELRKQHAHALDKADSIVRAAESAKRELTDNESLDVQTALAAARALAPQIKSIESKNSIAKMFDTVGGQSVLLIDGGRRYQANKPMSFSPEYPDDFFQYVASGGTKIGAALYEGSSAAGGYAVPITVDDQIVPLAPQEMAVRRLAQVVPTVSDVKVPVKASFGTASAKAENSAFTEIDPTLSQFTLSAFMAGIQETVSWELAQDVPMFQAFCVDDMILAQQMYEENLYINGTGSGQAQGLIGNVGGGVFEEPDGNGNLVTVNGTLDLLAKLNAIYHPNASWLMNRATSIVLRKAQVETNLFNPIFTRVGQQDFLHGYPVEYATAMPTAARGAAPILFGDFKRGYVIGDRGGSGINVKVLDQPAATLGQIILLAYRRTDGRVRRSEAIQQYNISAS
jgi:HK97 family phage major capsid protein